MKTNIFYTLKHFKLAIEVLIRLLVRTDAPESVGELVSVLVEFPREKSRKNELILPDNHLLIEINTYGSATQAGDGFLMGARARLMGSGGP